MRRVLLIVAAACGLLVVPAGSLAATIDVTTADDEFGENASPAQCSLREAVQAASEDEAFGGCAAGDAPGEDVIRLLHGGYALSRLGIDEDLNATGDLDLDVSQGPLRLEAAAPTQPVLDARGKDRAIDVVGDTALELEGVRVINGDPIGAQNDQEGGGALRWLAPGAPGDLLITDSVFLGSFAILAGAIDAQTGGSHLIEDSVVQQNYAADHGAIRSAGELTISGSTVSGNGGGGIFAEKPGPGSLALIDSAVTGNLIGADLSAGGVGISGDGTIVNSTISGNVGGFVGGVLPQGDLAVSFSTIASNGAPVTGGIDVASADSVTLEGSIVAGNEAPAGAPSNCSSAATLEGTAPNLESANSCGFETGAGSLVNSNPQLAPLLGNGGATQTMGLYPDSPAIDAAGSCAPLASDQRGSVRPLGAACDIGAFEGSVPRPPLTQPDDPATPTKPTKKKCKKAKRKRKAKTGKAKRCAKKKKKKRIKAGSAAPAAQPAAAAAGSAELIGRSVEGRPIRALQIGDPEAERVALVVGAIHGDERAGLRVTKRVRRLRERIEDAQIWIVDNLNPDGSRIDERRNARGVDLNRNFPHRWGSGAPTASGYYPGPSAASEPETRAAMRLIGRIEPDVSVWYHQPWGAVLSCRGRPKLAARYAKLAKMETSCAGRGLPGTAIGWQRDKVGGAAFVVEFGAGGISERTVARHARALEAITEDGLAAGRRSGAHAGSAAAKLKIAKRLIPYPRARKLDMAAYSKRHYGHYRWRLEDPKLIVIHFAVAGSIGSIYNTFAPNRPDVEYGELPGVCSHYAVGAKGGAVKFVPPGVRCRHVVGLNHVSVGIEHVGFSDREVLGRKAQLRGSLRLTQSLRCRFGIPVKRVIGHAESLSSPFYKELDPDFRGRTHGDFKRASMRVYRRALSKLGDC